MDDGGARLPIVMSHFKWRPSEISRVLECYMIACS